MFQLNFRNGVGVGHFSKKSPLTNFQTLAHQISLLASVNTLIIFFSIKLKNKPSYAIQAHFNEISIFTHI